MYDLNMLCLVNIKNIGFFKSILINGKGEFENNEVLLEVFIVDKKDNYLFWMIGVGFVDMFLFLIFGIFFIVKEMDGYLIVF